MSENASVAEAMLKITEQLAALGARLDALESTPRAVDQSEQDRADERIGERDAIKAEDSDKDDKANDQSKRDKDDERAGEERAMDAASVQAIVDAAVKAERQRAADLAAAKTATRSVLGDSIAMDAAGDVYRAALAQVGVDTNKIAAGNEALAWEAYQAAAGGARPAILANDHKGASAPAFVASLANIRNAG